MGSRLPELVYENLSPAQQKAYQMIAGPREGVVNGPFPAWIRTPELCTRIQSVSDILRSNTSLKKAMFEIITVVVARAFSANYMWGAHVSFAMRNGIPKEIIDDINSGKRPVFEDKTDQLIYDISYQLAHGKLLDENLYNEAVEKLGYEVLTEIATDVGFYLMIACVLNTYDVTSNPNSIPLASNE